MKNNLNNLKNKINFEYINLYYEKNKFLKNIKIFKNNLNKFLKNNLNFENINKNLLFGKYKF